MSNRRMNLTEAEWSLMDFLWSHAPSTGREAVEHCKKHIGWSRSTTLTVLRRVMEKGAVVCDETGDMNTYSPCIAREDAALRESEDFLDRVYKGSLSLMVSSMTKKQALSQKEIDELYAILKEMEENRDA